MKTTWLKTKLIEAVVGAPFALLIGYLIIKQKQATDYALEKYCPEPETPQDPQQ